jgi:hypothetical protein
MTLAPVLWESGCHLGGERDTAERQFGTRFNDSRRQPSGLGRSLFCFWTPRQIDQNVVNSTRWGRVRRPMLVSLLPNDLDWPLDDWQIALASVAFVAMLVLFIVVFKRSTASRAEFARLQEEAKQLSEDVKGLRVGEQRRFLQEIRAAKRCDTPTPKATSLRLPLCGHRFATSSLPSHSANRLSA